MKELIKIFLDLSKFRISFLATLSSATGFLIASGKISEELFFLTTGVFILACGSCALNQYQERKTDMLMERTRFRPIPSGRISPCFALFFSILLILTGSLLLLFGTNFFSFCLSVFTFFWYNMVYTPLKRKSSFATIPGAFAGAFTPAIGWLAGGRNVFEPGIFGIIFFLFIWQVPHFWLIFLTHRKDYEKSGLPVLTMIFTEEQVIRITFIWVLATAVTCLLLPLFLVNFYIVNFSLFFLTLWLTVNAFKMLLGQKKEILFACINIYAFLVISLIFLDKLSLILYNRVF